jgi:hypothetical protein
MEQNPDKGAVIFSTFQGGVDAVVAGLLKRGVKKSDIATWTGKTSTKKRRDAEDDLNSGKIKFLVANAHALQTGANLQKRANFVAYADLPWEPDVMTQSTARVYRQGQGNEVTVYRPTGSDVEEIISRSVSRKILQAAQATGNVTVADAALAGTIRGKNIKSLSQLMADKRAKALAGTMSEEEQAELKLKVQAEEDERAAAQAARTERVQKRRIKLAEEREKAAAKAAAALEKEVQEAKEAKEQPAEKE